MTDVTRSKAETTLCHLLKKASLEQLVQSTSCQDLCLADAIEHLSLGQVLASQMIQIIISGKDIKILFKIHFSPDQIKTLQADFNAEAAQAISDKKVIDYTKELANQIGGKICRIFESNGIRLGMSIPLCVRGFYEIYADYTAKSDPIVKFGDYWTITGKFGALFCSYHIELTDTSAFNDLEYPEDAEDEGDMEFL